MQTLNAATAGILTSSHVWPIGSTLALVGVVKLVHGLLAERARRKTLEMLLKQAPNGTLVIQHGVGTPTMTVKIGADTPSTPRHSPRRSRPRWDDVSRVRR